MKRKSTTERRLTWSFIALFTFFWTWLIINFILNQIMDTKYIVEKNNKVLFNNLIPSAVFHEPIKKMDKITITKTNGKWLVNGKPYNEINDKEKKFFDEFILAMKWEQEMIQHDNQLKNQ